MNKGLCKAYCCKLSCVWLYTSLLHSRPWQGLHTLDALLSWKLGLLVLSHRWCASPTCPSIHLLTKEVLDRTTGYWRYYWSVVFSFFFWQHFVKICIHYFMTIAVLYRKLVPGCFLNLGNYSAFPDFRELGVFLDFSLSQFLKSLVSVWSSRAFNAAVIFTWF